MQDLLKSSIYNMVGVLSVSQNKFKELVEELIQNGHYTEDEGKRIIDQFFYDLRLKVDNTTGGIQSKVEDFMKKWNIIDMSQLNQAKKDLESLVDSIRNNPLLPVKLNKRN
jgi:polyhydroxyalkanoate synthesis regulator phasin